MIKINENSIAYGGHLTILLKLRNLMLKVNIIH